MFEFVVTMKMIKLERTTATLKIIFGTSSPIVFMALSNIHIFYHVMTLKNENSISSICENPEDNCVLDFFSS